MYAEIQDRSSAGIVASGSRLVPPVGQSTAPWYLVYTKPRQEAVALTNLQQQGYEAYLPLYKVLKRSAGSASSAPSAVFEPMFARYVFFRPSSVRQSISAARSTRGVCSLVSFGFEPAVVSDETIDAVRACERTRSEADLASLSPFQVGCEVRLRNGPLKGLLGVVQMVSAKRVTLLLELLGKPQRIQMEHQALALA